MVTSRIRFTAGQKAELWERWKNGQSAAAISRALERKNKTGVERIVVVHGGIVPAPRQRALAALRLEEREEISRGIAVGRPIRLMMTSQDVIHSFFIPAFRVKQDVVPERYTSFWFKATRPGRLSGSGAPWPAVNPLGPSAP